MFLLPLAPESVACRPTIHRHHTPLFPNAPTAVLSDDRYCIDNGAMIAWPGLLAFKLGLTTPLKETTCTQRFRTDDVLVAWRDD